MKVTDSLENCMTETLKLKLDDEPVVGVGTYSKDAHFNTLKDAKKRPLVGKRMSRSIDAEKHVTNVHQQQSNLGKTASLNKSPLRDSFKRQNPYKYQMDLTSQKLVKSGQLSLEEQLKKLKDFQAGKADGKSINTKEFTQEQKQTIARQRGVPVSSYGKELQEKINSPFMKTSTPANYMKASLVNNSIFHAQFDATLVDDTNMAVAKKLLGLEETKKLAEKGEIYDKRYFQKYPKWKQKRSADEFSKKKLFSQQCRQLYTTGRMQLEQSLNESRRDRSEKEMIGFFDRSMIMNGQVPFPAEAFETSPELMSNLLEEYRNKLFPFHKLDEFLPPSDMSQEDIRRLMEATGRIKRGDKVYEPFAEYLKQRAIYDTKYGDWKEKKSIRLSQAQNKKSTSPTAATPNVDLVQSAHFAKLQHHHRVDSINDYGDEGSELDGQISPLTQNSPKKGSKGFNQFNSEYVANQKLSVIQHQQDSMFQKNFENTDREEIIHAERLIHSPNSPHDKSLFSLQDRGAPLNQQGSTLESNRMASSMARPSTKQRSKKAPKRQFKLPRRSTYELQNKISEARPNENIKKFAQMKVPFMSRNKILSNYSQIKSILSTNAPFSPFSTQGEPQQSFTAAPNSPTNADSNYLSRGSTTQSRQLKQRQNQSRQLAQREGAIQNEVISLKRPNTKQAVNRQQPLSPTNGMTSSRLDSKRQTQHLIDRSLDHSPASYTQQTSVLSQSRVGITNPKQTRFSLVQSQQQMVHPDMPLIVDTSLMRQSWADIQPNTSFQQKYRLNCSMQEFGKRPSRFQEDTYSQIDCLMTECNEIVPNLIGRVRKVRLSKDNMLLPKGYKTKELIGKRAAKNWREQLEKNKRMIKVLDTSKLNEEVDELLAQQRIQAKNDKAQTLHEQNSTRDQTQQVSHRSMSSRAITQSMKIDAGEFDDMPHVIRPLPPQVDSPSNAAQVKPISELIEDIEKEEEVLEYNFENKKEMQRYKTNDFKVKQFLQFCNAGRQKNKKQWMPGKTTFDKRGGKFSDRVSGLGQIPGLQ